MMIPNPRNRILTGIPESLSKSGKKDPITTAKNINGAYTAGTTTNSTNPIPDVKPMNMPVAKCALYPAIDYELIPLPSLTHVAEIEDILLTVTPF